MMKNTLILLGAAVALTASAAPRLILDSSQLDYARFTTSKLQKLNSGWSQEGTVFVRPFNSVPAGVVRYGTVLALPAGVTAQVRFVDVKGGVLCERKVAGGAPVTLRGSFAQKGELAALRIEPSKAIGPHGVFAKPFRVTVGWAVDEDFTYVAANAIPDGWRVKGAKVVPLPYFTRAGYGDRRATDAVLEIAPGGFADPCASAAELTKNYVFEFDACVNAETDLAAGGVRLRDHYSFVPGVWYHFLFEAKDGRAALRLNGRIVAKDVKTSGLAIENRTKGSPLLVDDVHAYELEEPADYPPAPVRPKGEEKWEVLINVCPLWHNGYHAGWRCIEAERGPKLALGYYDEGLPETADWEVKYMVEHGVDVQLFCWYPESHDGPIRQPRSEFHLRDGFKNARYSDQMKYALIWEIQNAGRPHSLEAWKKNYVPYLIEHHFKDPRYYAVEGKPMLAIFGCWNFKHESAFGSAAKTKEAFAFLDGELKKLGFKGLYTVWSHGAQNSPEIAEHGIDAVASYNYGIEGYKVSTQKARNLDRAKCPGAFGIPTVSVGYNSEPWHGQPHPMMTPADLETSLKWVRDAFIPSQPHKTDWEKRAVLISTWNEYGEGTYVMPTEDARGFGYLDAVRTVFTDEKPDPKLNLRPTAVQRARIGNLYPRAMLVSSASSMENVRPRVARKMAPVTAFAVRLAKGERESFQVLVTSSKDLKNVRVTVGDGARREGGGVFAAKNVACPVMGYVETVTKPPYLAKLPNGATPGWWPDPILDFQTSADVKAGDVQSFWVRVTCPRDQPAGVYEATLTVSAEGVPAQRFPLTVRVSDFAVPKASPLPLAVTFAPMYHSSLDDRAAPPPDEKKLFDELKADPESPVNAWKNHRVEWCDFLADYYLTPDSLYWRGKGRPYYDLLSRLKEQGRLGTFNLGYWGYPKTNSTEAIAAWRDGTLPRLREAYEEAKRRGILDKAYLYGCDEIPEKDFPMIRLAAETLRKEFPGVPLSTTAYDHSYGEKTVLSLLDAFTPLTDKFDPVKAAAARARGREVWWYICCVPHQPYANMFIESPAIEGRLLMGAMTARYRPDGFLYYETSIWNSRKPVSKGPFTDWTPRSWNVYNGDGAWIGVGPGGTPLATQRLENFRDGLEDYAYVKLLEQRLAAADPATPWARAARRAIAVPTEVVTDLKSYTRDPAVLLKWRETIADLLEARRE